MGRELTTAGPLWTCWRCRRRAGEAFYGVGHDGAVAYCHADDVRRFVDDDSGFLEGVAHNPEGFILNTLPKRTRAYLILHRSSCRTVGGEPARGSRWTVDCIKFCGDQLPLRSRLRAHIALMPQRQCGLGIVSRQQPRLQVRRWLDMRLDP